MNQYFNVEDEFLRYLSGCEEMAKYAPIFGRIATEKDSGKSVCVFRDGGATPDVVTIAPRLRMFFISEWSGVELGALAGMSDDMGRLEFFMLNNKSFGCFSKVSMAGGIIGPKYTEDGRIVFETNVSLIT